MQLLLLILPVYLYWLSAILILIIAKYYWLAVSVVPRCITIPNFIKIGPSVAEIW